MELSFSHYLWGLEQLEKLMSACILSWQHDEDWIAYPHFVQILELLELLLEAFFDKLEHHQVSLYLILEQVHQSIKHQDVLAVIDLLEYELQPLIASLRKAVSPDDRPFETFAG